MSNPSEIGKVFNLTKGDSVIRFNGRQGAVIPQAGDYTPDMVGAAAADHTHDEFSAKQDKLTGTSGQVVGFDASGSAVSMHGWSNLNLLDNWYFVDPIDQRAGLIVPAGVAYYAAPDTEGLALTDRPYTANAYNDWWVTISINNTTYYVPKSSTIKGYCENGYTIDRWYSYECVSVNLLESGVQIIAKSSGSQFVQAIPLEEIEENTLLTLSFLDTDGELTVCTGRAAHNAEHSLYANTDWGWISFRNLPNVPYWQAVFHTTVNKTLVAAKLELGSHQTLAHKEGDTWVLNDPPPNKALELAKCQRYQQVFRDYSFLGVGIAQANHEVQISIPTPVTMRLHNVACSGSQLGFFDGAIIYDVLSVDPAAACNAGSAKFNVIADSSCKDGWSCIYSEHKWNPHFRR